MRLGLGQDFIRFAPFLSFQPLPDAALSANWIVTSSLFQFVPLAPTSSTSTDSRIFFGAYLPVCGLSAWNRCHLWFGSTDFGDGRFYTIPNRLGRLQWDCLTYLTRYSHFRSPKKAPENKEQTNCPVAPENGKSEIQDQRGEWLPLQFVGFVFDRSFPFKAA